MGKRLIRILGKDIPTRVKELISIELNVVLKNKATIHGVLTKLENNSIIIKDMRLRDHQINLSDVEELVFDREAAY